MDSNYSVKIALKPFQSGQVWSLPITKCFEKCSTTLCFMTLNLYDIDKSKNTEYIVSLVLNNFYLDMSLLASNVFYPVSFTEVELPTAKIAVTNVSQVTATSATVSEITTFTYWLHILMYRSH